MICEYCRVPHEDYGRTCTQCGAPNEGRTDDVAVACAEQMRLTMLMQAQQIACVAKTRFRQVSWRF